MLYFATGPASKGLQLQINNVGLNAYPVLTLDVCGTGLCILEFVPPLDDTDWLSVICSQALDPRRKQDRSHRIV